MILAAGDRLGPYEILAPIGAGGMGEVYRASDPRLGRDVAIKILPRAFTSDPGRLARFEREARALGALNHPHIGAIYGFEEFDGVRALVLELVEGPTLADRVARGPIPLVEALSIARQICQALDGAHQQGIIHRDLKPANIKVRTDGAVKVLDFGLAKASGTERLGPDQAQVPTETLTGTREGVLLGTPAYMSPEQARGLVVDKRADVWAFGCVLYQMLSGREAFTGSTVPDILAAILEREPNWDELSQTPTSIKRLLRRCLDKDHGRRLRDMGDALADIEDASTHEALERQTLPNRRASSLSRSVWVLATTAATAAMVTLLVVWNLTRSTQLPPTLLTVAAPSGTRFAPALPAFSRDGRTLVFAACTKCDTEDLDDWVAYRQPLDQWEAVPIPGVRAFFFFFRPDGGWLGFCTRDALKKVSLAGGPPVPLYEGIVLGADWGADDTIVLGTLSGLMRISANGGQPQRITTSLPGKLHLWPTIVPGGRSVLFTVWDNSTPGEAQMAVVSLETREVRTLVRGSGGRLLASGHMVFGRERSLWAIPFDMRRQDVVGEAVPVLEGAVFTTQFGLPLLAVASNGSMAYLAGKPPGPPVRALVWVTRDGDEEAFKLREASYGWPRVSPDGASIALDIVDSPGHSDIWIYDVARGTNRKLTMGPGMHMFPLWTQDGQRVVFSTAQPFFGLLSQNADGSEPARPVIEPAAIASNTMLAASSWSRDGKTLVVNYLAGQQQMGENAPFDIGVFPTDSKGPWKPFLNSDAAEVAPVVSPDGGWIAYSSNRTGKFEIYVDRFPGLGGNIVSTNGGVEPLWSPGGNELFYRSPDGRKLLRVAFDAKSGSTRGSTTVLFEGAYASYLGGFRLRAFDVTPDGKRFVMLKAAPPSDRAAAAPTQLRVVLNWLEAVKQRVPAK